MIYRALTLTPRRPVNSKGGTLFNLQNGTQNSLRPLDTIRTITLKIILTFGHNFTENIEQVTYYFYDYKRKQHEL